MLLNTIIMTTIICLYSSMYEEDILEYTNASCVHYIQLIDYCVT